MKILVSYRAIDNTAGGVERISTWLMNELVKHNHEVEFVTLDPEHATSFYEMQPAITWHRLGIGNPSQKANPSTRLKRILSIRKIIKDFRPDIAIGFQEASFLSARLAAIGLDTPVIAAERNAPSRFKYMPKTKAILAFLSFFFAKFITVQMKSFPNDYPSWLRSRIRIIPNPVSPVEIKNTFKENIVLSVGRLEYQKNFPCLVESFAKIAAEFSDWKLVIVGDGHDRLQLEKMIAKSYLQDRILLPGSTSDLSAYYSKAQIFCLPSRWEGFPNALSEALANGLPSIGFKACDGVKDLIIHGYNGLLVDGNDNPDRFAEALSQLIKQEKTRDEMSQNAINSIKPYEPSAIFSQWEQLFKDAGSKGT